MSVIGGNNSNQLLSYLDYELIKKANKKIIGYSDTTALLNGIYAKTGICTYLGPSFINFCNPSITRDVEKYFLDVVIEEKNEIVYKSPEEFSYDDWYLKKDFGPRENVKHKGYKFIKKGKTNGKVIGGNCQTLLKLAGTEFFPDTQNKILIIEDLPNHAPGAFISEVTQLKDMGVFKKISGLIVGQFGYLHEFYEVDEFENKILDSCKDTDFPILINLNFSHTDPLYSVKIGGEMFMDSNRNILKLVN